MANKWLSKLVPKRVSQDKSISSWLRYVTTGSLYKMSDIRGDSAVADIRTQIDTLRALAKDSQIATALSYYATDATIPNTKGEILWATPIDPKDNDVADVVNQLIKRLKISTYARDHILELATIGNLYIPTTLLYKVQSQRTIRRGVVLDNNTIADEDFDIVPSYKIPPETIIHLFYQGEEKGYVMDTDEKFQDLIFLPEAACIHFSLGGLLGEYTITAKDSTGEEMEYDIKFAQPLMERAVTPTQTLNLLEDSLLLASLTRIVKFVNVECGSADEDEIEAALLELKQTIEQQLSLHTGSGDVQSYVNPQSPNNLIYLPKVNGQDAVTVTDLNMAEATEQDSKLLEYFQNKKLSVLGVPKEAMNFSSAEGLGGAGAVMSQRSALYANALQRIETAYTSGWTDAFNLYFTQRGMSGFVDKFQLHMSPIVTQLSTVQSERKDAALSQVQQLVDTLKSLGVKDKKGYRKAIMEILTEAFPGIGADAASWDIDIENAEGEGGTDAF